MRGFPAMKAKGSKAKNDRIVSDMKCMVVRALTKGSTAGVALGLVIRASMFAAVIMRSIRKGCDIEKPLG